MDRSHLESFYTSYDQIKDKNYDGLVITGAPVENLDFETVDYWEELCQIMEWSKTHVHSTLHICWGAQAGLYYHYGIPKYALPQKLFGVFDHRVLKPSSPLFGDLTTGSMPPHSPAHGSAGGGHPQGPRSGSPGRVRRRPGCSL